MSGNDASVIDRLRKPEYTGENRCTPCTIVNAGIAAVASALAWVVAAGAIGESAAGALGVGLFAACLGIIYLRGYLVPGTPTLTKRYLPNRVLALFDKHPLDQQSEEESWDAGEREEEAQRTAVDPEQFLLEADVVAPCEREDDLCLSDEFADRLEDHTERFRSSEPDVETFADLFDADPESVTVEDREYPTVEIRNRVRKWPSEGALIADVAADRALRDQSGDWTAVPLEQRLKILESLRSFRQSCPLCSGGVELGTETVESCCRSYEVATASCLDCGETLLEFDPSAIDAAAEKEAV